jgi:hypothetical protein
MNEIIIALIGAASSFVVGLLSFLAVVITNRKSNKDIEQKWLIAQAVTDTKIEELTREVREHNNFARRMPVVESRIEHIVEQEEHLQNEIDHLRSFHERG